MSRLYSWMKWHKFCRVGFHCFSGPGWQVDLEFRKGGSIYLEFKSSPIASYFVLFLTLVTSIEQIWLMCYQLWQFTACWFRERWNLCHMHWESWLCPLHPLCSTNVKELCKTGFLQKSTWTYIFPCSIYLLKVGSYCTGAAVASIRLTIYSLTLILVSGVLT